ncbi:DNA replication regulator Sld3 [Penicillium chermesinum]|nr:DNA replication regulator Sld3 [Penicillium chermesinum]
MTARTIPSALDPLSSSMLNKLHEAQPPTKKRKIGRESSFVQCSTTSIVIKAPITALSNEPLVLNPITTLPRSRLPLSWIEDASWSHSDAQPGGMFAADIPALETDLSACTEPTVLAVRLAPDRGLYVVERVKRGIYSLSRLARWVHEGEIAVAVKGWQSTQVGEMKPKCEDKAGLEAESSNWWQAAQIPEPPSDLGPGDELAGLQVAVVFEDAVVEAGSHGPSFVDVLEHRSQSLVPAARRPSGGSLRIDSQASFIADAMDVDQTAESQELEVKQTPEELLDGMRDNYLEALYVSKTSVAYFAKGPLTRCRNAFQSGDEKSHSPAALIDYYREAILAAKKMDTKYRETLPVLVRDAMLAVSDDEAAPAVKKRKSKKKKLGRNGMYPEEDGFVHRWWKARAMTELSPADSSREAESKKHISDLRLRETQLQILLILEVIALEMSTKTDKKTTSEENGDEKEEPPKSKTKKPQDLDVLLELHLDRMCIWHAVSSEDTSAADSAKSSLFKEDHMSGKKAESDGVRDFCTEVIVPFYAARLPEKCKLITRKFGVTSGVSPGKKSSSKRERLEPGSEVVRKPPQKDHKRSLHRVSTEQRTATTTTQKGPPSLTRSNTAPTKVGAKRDLHNRLMEPTLPTIGNSVRGGIQQSRRMEPREIDLGGSRQTDSKSRRAQILAEQKKELDAAILALRKPNRELVAKDIANDATKRASTGGGSSRKPKNPVRNPLGQGVQVMATPRGNRKKDAAVGMPPPAQNSLVNSDTTTTTTTTIPAREPTPPAILGTPLKDSVMVPVTPDKSQSKSIYEQLGWDDDDMEL